MSDTTLIPGERQIPLKDSDTAKARAARAKLSKTETFVLEKFMHMVETETFCTERLIEQLGVAKSTYKFHMTSIYNKFGMENVQPADKKIALLQILFTINRDLLKKP